MNMSKNRLFSRWLTALLTAALLLQPFAGVFSAAAASSGNLDVAVVQTYLPNFGDGSNPGLQSKPVAGYELALGRETDDLAVKITNNSSQWAYNIGVQLLLDDGLEIAAPTASSVSDGLNGKQIAYWQDVKNLAPGESYYFPVKVQSTEEYRNGGGQVPFGAQPVLYAEVYGSDAARNLYKPPNTASAVSSNATIKVVPFTIKPSLPDKAVKGAGSDSTGSGEWGEFEAQLQIVNNTRSGTTFSSITNRVDSSTYENKASVGGGLQLYGTNPTAGGVTTNIPDNSRSFSWSNLTLGTSSDYRKTLTYKGAFLDRELDRSVSTVADADNKGEQIKDGRWAYGNISYQAQVGGEDYNSNSPKEYPMAVAKDIVVWKTVSASPAIIGPGTVLTYTLKVKTNEYYDVEDVVITDTIGDGQTLVLGSLSKAADSSFSGSRETNGTTKLQWTIPDEELSAKDTLTITYETTVDPTWFSTASPFSGKQVVAGDELVNHVAVTGSTSVSGLVSDGDYTVVRIENPNIAEAIHKINDSEQSSSPPVKESKIVTVGDIVEFKIDYKATDLPADQSQVVIMDYFPLGTQPLDSSGNPLSDGLVDDSAFQFNGYFGIKPTYIADENLLVWDFGSTPIAANTGLSKTIKVRVLDDAANVVADKKAENLVILSYANTLGRVESKRDTVKITYAEPKIKVDRSVSVSGSGSNPLDVTGGDTVTVTITLENIGGVPAYNVDFTELLPPELVYVDGTAAIVSVGTATTGTTGYTAAVGSNPAQIEYAVINSISPGAGNKITLAYQATVLNPVLPNQNITQGSTVEFDNKADTSGRHYAPLPESKVTLHTKMPTITKTKHDSSNPEGSNIGVGDWVIYKIAATIPKGLILYKPKVEDVIHAGQSPMEVFSNYDSAADSGTSVPAGTGYGNYSSSGNTVAIPLADSPNEINAAGGTVTKTYYVKTKVIAGTSPQSSAASLKWTLTAGDNDYKSVSKGVGISVETPNLTSTITPASADLDIDTSTATPDSVALTYTVTNAGAGTAYDFTPRITVQDGFEIIEATGGLLSDSNRTATFSRQNLNPGVSVSFPVTVKLIQVKGSGSSHPVSGQSGDYYTSSLAYADDSYKADPYSTGHTSSTRWAKTSSTAQLHVPGVTLEHKIIVTTNEGFSLPAGGGVAATIRPGDVVEYQLTVTVPVGTLAYDLVVEDTVAGLAAANQKFEVVSQTLADNALSGGGAAQFDQSTGKLVFKLQDSPNSNGHVYVNTVKLRALKDGSSPEGTAAGSFATASAPFTATAQAVWNTENDTGSTAKFTPVQVVTTTVIQPKLTLTANEPKSGGIANSTFSDANPVIVAGYTLANAWTSPAFVPSVKVTIPDELNVLNPGAITHPNGLSSDNVIYTPAGGGVPASIEWLDVTVGGNSSLTLPVSLGLNSLAGASRTGLHLAVTADKYRSTPVLADQTDPTTEQQTKVYDLTVLGPQALAVAPPTVSATVNGSTYEPAPGGGYLARPGDELTYKVTVNLPGASTAYDASLKDSGLAWQTIKEVRVNSDTITKVDGKYPLGDLNESGTHVITVVTEVDSTGNYVPNPYKVSFQPAIDYSSVSGSSVRLPVQGNNVEQDVIEPELIVRIVPSTDISLGETGETGSFALELSHADESRSAAHSPTVVLAVPEGVYLASVTGATYTANSLTWTPGSIPLDGTARLEFTVGSLQSTPVSAAVYELDAALTAYYSRPAGSATGSIKSYGPHSANEVGVIVQGQHVLEGSFQHSTTAGLPVEFAPHKLMNTGAGRDTFLLDIATASSYPADLYVGDTWIATGHLSESAWVWDEIAAEYTADGKPAIINLDAGASIPNLKLTIRVPEQALYGDSYTYSLTATGKGSGQAATTQDTLTITGTPLDGWTGDWVWSSDSSGWAKPEYGKGDTVTLQAVSAVHIQQVQANFTVDTGAGRNPYSFSNVPLTVANSTYIQDGYKLWSAAVTLPAQVIPDDYGVTFTASSATAPDETDAYSETVTTGVNNYFKVAYTVTVKGTVTDSVYGEPIAGAQVYLADPAEPGTKLFGPVTTDSDGSYAIPYVPVDRASSTEAVDPYLLYVAKPGYSPEGLSFYAIPLTVTDTVYTVDAQLVPYRITLVPDPGAIVGNGTSTTTLIATVTDKDGQPVPGVAVTFSNPGDPEGKGSFPGSKTATTGADGKASVPFQSDIVTGFEDVPAPVKVGIDALAGTKSGVAAATVLFQPGAIAGVVTEIVYGTYSPVAGAAVTAWIDTNGNGAWDAGEYRSDAQSTDAEGRYLIPVPQTDTLYSLAIVKPLVVQGETLKDTQGQTRYAAYPQIAAAGTVEVDGVSPFPGQRVGGGVMLVRTPAGELLALGGTASAADGSGGTVTKAVYELVKGELSYSVGGDIQETPVTLTLHGDGTFHFILPAGLPHDGEYRLKLFWEHEGRRIFLNETPEGVLLKLTEDAELNLAMEVIAPFGKVTDKDTAELLSGAEVKLYYADTARNREAGVVPEAEAVLPVLGGFPPIDNAGTQVTGGDGRYAYLLYGNTDYYVIIERPGYYTFDSRNDTAIDGKIGTAEATARYDAKLTKKPSAITLTTDHAGEVLGNGMAEITLTATLVDSLGVPVPNAPLTVTVPAGKGSFPNGATAVTDENGQASITYRSYILTGSEPETVIVSAIGTDPLRGIEYPSQIIVTVKPGAIAGYVSEIAGGVRKLVSGAKVTAWKDFDGDGTIDFTSPEYTTGSDGYYVIPIPQGNTEYNLTVSKPLVINGNPVLDSEGNPVLGQFPQRAAVGQSAAGTPSTANKAGGGTLLVKSPDGDGIAWLDNQVEDSGENVYNKVQNGYLVDSKGEAHDVTVQFANDGTFHFELPDGMEAGQYHLRLFWEYEGKKLFVNGKDGLVLEIQQNGEINLTTELIDPYGTISDKDTGAPIKGAHVELYYADTARNRAGGSTPGTLVKLPELIGFAPADNANPQDSDANGQYAYMVYGNTDYYIIATAPGYYTYDSRKDASIGGVISVGEEIVKYDIPMTKIAPVIISGGGYIPAPAKPAADPADLAVELTTDRAAYPEGQLITYTIEYLNRSDIPVTGAVVKATIPAHTSIVEANGGKVGDNGTISWTIGDLAAGARGTITYQVRIAAESLPQAELVVHNEASISAGNPLVKTADDSSGITVLLFSGRYGAQLHKRYIAGYPDGLFKADRAITRAETAAIFARILDLQKTVTGEVYYSDVAPDFWAAEYIETATRVGLFGGYEDGTFKPDAAITRAELGTVILRFLKIKEAPGIREHFTDTADHWGKDVIAQIFRHHIIDGYPDGTFRPDQGMIRSEAVTMINRMLYRGPLLGADVSFPDMTPDHWAFGQVEESAITHEYTRNADGSEALKKYIPEPLW